MTTAKSKRITNKYDLMHRNTPSFASTVVTWDTSKLTEITFNRVIQAIKDGFIKYRTGDACAMYHAVREQFEIPQFKLDEPKRRKDGQMGGGYIHWEYPTDKLYEALEPIYQAERVAYRLENNYIPWYLEADHLPKDRKYLYVDNTYDFSEVRKEMDRIMNSEEVAQKRKDAIEFVQSGGKFQFTWR